MKNLLTLILLAFCVTIFSQDLAESDFSEIDNIEISKINNETTKQIINFNKDNFKIKVNNFENEVVKGVYFFDKKRKLISKFKNIKINSSIEFNVEGVNLINVITDKGYYFILIRK